MSVVGTITEDIGKSLIADVSNDVADALIAKGVIPEADKPKMVGSINYLGDVALQAYLTNKL